MEKSELENLISGQPDNIKAKGILLFNGVATCALTYQKNPTASNLRDLEAAETALNKFKAQIEDGENIDSFSTIADVLEYLDTSGWKVTKTSLYRHQSEGKIMPAADGCYRQKDVDKYAKTWLKEKSTGKKLKEKTDELQRKKLDLELQNLDLEKQRKSFALDRERGKFILREQMEIELATRAGILDAGLKHWVQSRTAEWIRTVAGDMKKVGDLINLMNRDLDEHINSYASQVEYQVVIEAAETDELEQGEQAEC